MCSAVNFDVAHETIPSWYGGVLRGGTFLVTSPRELAQLLDAKLEMGTTLWNLLFFLLETLI